MLRVAYNKIYLTRGDTAYLEISITDETGNAYELSDGDKIIFRMKQSTNDKNLILEKEFNTEILRLELKPEDTMSLKFGKYRYEVELVTGAGEHFTVIENSELEITSELENH